MGVVEDKKPKWVILKIKEKICRRVGNNWRRVLAEIDEISHTNAFVDHGDDVYDLETVFMRCS